MWDRLCLPLIHVSNKVCPFNFCTRKDLLGGSSLSCSQIACYLHGLLEVLYRVGAHMLCKTGYINVSSVVLVIMTNIKVNVQSILKHKLCASSTIIILDASVITVYYTMLVSSLFAMCYMCQTACHDHILGL